MIDFTVDVPEVRTCFPPGSGTVSGMVEENETCKIKTK
jgi:hypothetical protein